MPIRRGGALLQQDEELRPEQKAVSPLAGAQTGDTPDQAKMRPTPAAKKPVIEEAVEPKETLAGAKRYEAPREKATEVEAGVTSMASRLQRVSGLGDRVQEVARQRIEAAQTAPAALQIDESVLEARGVEGEQKEALEAYMAAVQDPNTTPEQRVVAQEAMFTKFQDAGLDPTSFLQETGIGLASQFETAAAIPPTMTLGELASEGQPIGAAFGYEGEDADLAADLGVAPEELAGMNIEAIQQRIQDIEQEDFSRVEGLKAELQTASPDRREAIMEELKDLGAVGIAGVEAAVDDLAAQLDEADQVSFAGQTYTLQELLDNEAISSTITATVRDEAQLEELRTTEPELAAWIEQNKASLDSLVGDIEQQTGEFQELQEQFRELKGEVSDETLAAIMGISPDELGFASQQELEQYQAQLEQSGAFQAAKDDPTINALIKENPEIIKDLEGKTSSQIKQAHENAQRWEADETLRDILGDPPEGKFVFDNADFEKYTAIIDAAPEEVRAYPDFAEMVKTDFLTKDEAAYLKKRPEEFAEIQGWWEDKKKFDKATDLEDVFAVMGVDRSISDITKDYNKLKKWAALGDPKAKKAFNNYKKFFDPSGDGKIDQKDFKVLKARVGKRLGKPDAKQIMAGGYDSYSKKKSNVGGVVASPQTSSNYVKSVESFLGKDKEQLKLVSDGKLDSKELFNLYQSDPAKLKKMRDDPALKGLFAKKDVDKFEKARDKHETGKIAEIRTEHLDSLNETFEMVFKESGILKATPHGVQYDLNVLKRNPKSSIGYINDAIKKMEKSVSVYGKKGYNDKNVEKLRRTINSLQKIATKLTT